MSIAGLVWLNACVLVWPPVSASGCSCGQAVMVSTRGGSVDEVIKLYAPVSTMPEFPPRSLGPIALLLSAMMELLSVRLPREYRPDTLKSDPAVLKAIVALVTSSGPYDNSPLYPRDALLSEIVLLMITPPANARMPPLMSDEFPEIVEP